MNHLNNLLSFPVVQFLKNKDIFNNLEIDHGVVTWDNGKIDIAPEGEVLNQDLTNVGIMCILYTEYKYGKSQYKYHFGSAA